jgi:hypothetical protein
VKGIALVALTAILFPVIFAVIYGWPTFLKSRIDDRRRKLGLEPLKIPLKFLFAISLIFGLWTYGIGYMLLEDEKQTAGIIIVLLGMPAWMFVIFGGINALIKTLAGRPSDKD